MAKSRGSWLQRPMVWRGFLAIGFGCYVLSGIRESVPGLATVLGLYTGLETLGALWAAVAFASTPLIAIAAIDGLTSLFLLLHPDPTLVLLAYVVGAWAMSTGLLELFAAGLSRAKRLVRSQAAAGLVSIALGVLLALFPTLGRSDFAGLIGAALVWFGFLCLPAAQSTESLRGKRPAPPFRRGRRAA